MTGGGTATVAYVHEPVDDYAGSPTDSDYKTPGKDHTITDLSIDNALARLRNSGFVEQREAIKTTFEGALGVEFALGNPWFLNHVFGGTPSSGGSSPTTYTWSPQSGRVQSSRWYIGVDYLDGTAEREVAGVVFPQMELSWNGDDVPRVSLTGFYASEDFNTSITPGSTPTEQQTTYAPSALTLDIPNSSTVAKLQSATLTVAPNSRPHRGTDPEPIDAVIGDWTTDLTVESIITETSYLQQAYGGSSATSTQAAVDAFADATLDFQGPNNDAFVVGLTGLTPSTYSWNEIGNPENDITESVDFAVDGIEIAADSSEGSAR